ncbi:glycosyltransferase, partial [Acinetobacter baumannii]|uniref:glycosyltransferase n=1 Tax=Acinetobacter baumannii TaxID=470 RepID=UPI000AF82B97
EMDIRYRDNTGEVLECLAEQHEILRVVHLTQNQGKVIVLHSISLMTDAEFLMGIDGDALLDPHAAKRMVRYFLQNPSVAAVTGNPRIRTRSTLLGRI